MYGAVLGAAYLRGTQWFITAPEWYLLSTGVGVLFVLLVVPGGLASLAVRLRDVFVGAVRRRAERPSDNDADAASAAAAPTAPATSPELEQVP